ncbi:hypothetical protein ASF49_03120 [Methylobacterium sp. Leaf104]|uniref:DUF2628 domain-containing protein n=1 Tax=Methylobacterium TaxID=407 RepID=UPI0006FB9218|nr:MULTISPECIES: DUF2628 domain-containing protein [Methylobacterium]KQP42833.1 hypothetical protein ASF49_03120 [Methylobacterium sp. Leaf104]MCI9878581.1 DUF2628 domain-containing protein [Methylobacterium goesingense]
MRTYTLHPARGALAGEAHGLERAHLVPDGFSWPAFAFGPLWFFFHRLWLAGLGVLALLVLVAFGGRFLGLTPIAGSVITLLISILIGLEASSLRRWTYARAGRPVRDAITAANAEEAEMKAAARWLAGASVGRAGPASQVGVSVPPGDLAIGMFPFSEGRQ